MADIKKTIIDSYYIMAKDLREFARNRMGLVFLFIMPLFMLIMTGFIFPSGSVQMHMPVALVDLDHGAESMKFIAQLEAMNNNTSYMDFTTVSGVEDAKTKITRGELYGAFIIPEGFTYNVTHGHPANITVYVDKSNPQVAAQIQGVASGVINGLGTMKAVSNVMTLSVQANQTVNPVAIISPYVPDVQTTVPGHTNYFDFVAPGLMIMIVMMSAMTGIPRAISHEKEIGTFDGVLSAPISQISVIVGKTVAQSVRGFIQGLLVLILAMVLFGVTVQGSILLAFFMLFLGIFSFIGVGILFTSMAGDEETGNMVMGLLQFPMMFLSGIFFPIQQMPWFMQEIAHLIPLTYAAAAMRKVMILNAGVSDVLPEIAILLGFGIVTMVIAIPLFRRSMTR
jgi:ABC-2 type transport system permease protein